MEKVCSKSFVCIRKEKKIPNLSETKEVINGKRRRKDIFLICQRLVNQEGGEGLKTSTNTIAGEEKGGVRLLLVHHPSGEKKKKKKARSFTKMANV